MNPSTAFGRVLVDELIRSGVRDVVVAPGSRSAPLALAFHQAAAEGRLRLHVRVDERSAGFLALGLAKGSHRPVPVVTTSGTAAANLHPAVLEAAHTGVGLIAVTADRPAELRGSLANQTTDQVKIFGDAVESYTEIPAAEVVPASSAAWRAAVSRAIGASARGPVHVNVCLRDPLLPDPDETALPAGLAGRADGGPWARHPEPPSPEPTFLPLGPRTVVVAGDDAGPPARILAQDARWPLLAEPSSGSRTHDHPIATYRLLLALPELGERIERVVVLGRPTLSRPVTRLLGRSDVEIVAVPVAGAYANPAHAVSRVVGAVTVEGPDDPAWFEQWRTADEATLAAVEDILASYEGLTPHAVAREVSAAVPAGGLLVVGSSNPVRDLDLMAISPPPGERRMVMANRGLSGIDGMVSTAVGAALGRRSTRSLAYVGDLTFLHDSNGLLLGPDEPRPDLTIVVASDDGGSIFATLEQGAPGHAAAFERVFGTPTGADLGLLCAATGTPHALVTDVAGLRAALRRAPHGIEVVEARIGRMHRRDLDAHLQAAARLQ